MLTKKDFKYKNELLYPLNDDQQFNYFTLVQGNATNGAEDDEISEEEYVFTRLVFGFKYCEKFRTVENYEIFLELEPSNIYIAEVMGNVPESIQYLNSKLTTPNNSDDLFYIMNVYEPFATNENFKTLVEFGINSHNVTTLFCKYKSLQTLSNLALWVQSKPTTLQIEKAMNETKIARHSLIVQLYLKTKGDKVFSKIIKEVAKETNSLDLLKGHIEEK